MMCSVMNSRGSKIRMAGKAPSSHLPSVPSSNKSSAANSALNDNGNKNMYICTFAFDIIYVNIYDYRSRNRYSYYEYDILLKIIIIATK